MADMLTDGNVVQIARQLDILNKRMTRLILQIEASEHPNADAIVQTLRENGFDNPAWATHCVRENLLHPENWEEGNHAIHRIRKAIEVSRQTRFHRGA